MEKSKYLLQDNPPGAGEIGDKEDEDTLVVGGEEIVEKEESSGDESMEDECFENSYEEASVEGESDEVQEEEMIDEDVQEEEDLDEEYLEDEAVQEDAPDAEDMEYDDEENIEEEEYEGEEEEGIEEESGGEDVGDEEGSDDSDVIVIVEDETRDVENDDVSQNNNGPGDNAADSDDDDLPSVIYIRDKKNRRPRESVMRCKFLHINDDGKFLCYKCQEAFSCPVGLKAHFIGCLKLTPYERRMLEREMFKEMRDKMNAIQMELRNMRRIQRIKKIEKMMRKQERKAHVEKKILLQGQIKVKKEKGDAKAEVGESSGTSKEKNDPKQEVKGKNKKENKMTQTVSSNETFPAAEVINAIQEALMKNVTTTLVYSPNVANDYGNEPEPENNSLNQTEDSEMEGNPMLADNAEDPPDSE